MSRISKALIAPAVLAGLAFTTISAFAQEVPAEGPVPTTALITVQSKSGEPLDPAQLRLQINRHDAPITSVTPVKPAAAQVAILIDDGVRSSFSNQLSDFSDFISQLPQGTKVFLGYMQNGTVRSSMHGFSADHAAVAQQLRIPFSVAGVDASPYFCLSEFVKHWPSNEPGPRFVLLITNGVDPYNGRPSVLNQDSPYVQAAQEDAERAGVAVYSIYYAESGLRGGRGSFSGQSYLQQVAEATGGESFYQGNITPPSLSPYLNMFAKSIAESYTVSFTTNATNEKRDSITQIKLTTKQPGVKIHAPEGVHPGVDLQ
jgi:hypothetical protein